MTNDRVRVEALGSIAKAREVEAMQTEVEQMAEQRETKNSYIAKLVADNEWMAQKIETQDARCKATLRMRSPVGRENEHHNGGVVAASRGSLGAPGTESQATSQPIRTTAGERRKSPLRLKATIHK